MLHHYWKVVTTTTVLFVLIVFSRSTTCITKTGLDGSVLSSLSTSTVSALAFGSTASTTDHISNRRWIWRRRRSMTTIIPSAKTYPSALSSSSSSSTDTSTTSDTVDDVVDGVVFEELHVKLPTTGVTAQIIYAHPSSKTEATKNERPPLVFLHGSFHGAWCWKEHWLSYFVKRLGYTKCVALNWRGTHGTPVPIDPTEGEREYHTNTKKAKKIRIVEHADDLRGLLQILPSILADDDADKDEKEKRVSSSSIRPILISHSMGGIYVMKYLEELFEQEDNYSTEKLSDMFSAIITLCSTPPSGNGPSTMRVIRRSLKDAYRITIGFVLKKVNTNASICRQCFFGGDVVKDENGNVLDDHGVSDDDIRRYQSHFTQDSKVVLDVSDLSRYLPSKKVDKDGRAPFVSELPPCLVVGATKDFIVDRIGVEETASYYGVPEPVFVDSPHDVMLGKNWQTTANVINEWIEHYEL